jgi:alcohol dehydrogenase (cytochrome c)
MIRTALLLSILVCMLQTPSGAGQASTDSCPTYNGDFTGRRFSQLTKINDRNVKG